MINIFDLCTNEIKCQLTETKGCTLFSVQERNCFLIVINRKKFSFYLWQASGFDFVAERSLPDIPKLVYCLPQSVIFGYRRFYESVDVSSFSSPFGMTGPGSLSTGTYVKFQHSFLASYYWMHHIVHISIYINLCFIIYCSSFQYFFIFFSVPLQACIGSQILDIERDHTPLCCLELPEGSHRLGKF